MTDDPASFAAFKWSVYTLAAFNMKAEQELADELLQTPDMTTREQAYFFRMAFMGAQFERRAGELKVACRTVDKLTDEIKILNAKLDHMGTLAKERGAYIWEVMHTLELRGGAATLEEVEAMRLLMESAPLEIRIKPSAKNPYKLTSDAFKWTIKLAEEAGRKVKKEVSTIRKLRCLRFYVNVTIPKRIKELRRLPGEPKPLQAWAANYTPYFRDFRDFRKPTYDPGG
jgi:hypothetical protein